METNKIYHEDCIEGLYSVPNSSVDLVVTSPPYKDEDGYSEDLIDRLKDQLERVLKPNSLLFVNFGHLAGAKSRPFKLAICFESSFSLIDTIIWQKPQYRPLQGDKRLNNISEFIFMFGKGEPKIDRLAIGIPYEDKTNVKRYAGGRDLKCRANIWKIGYETITNRAQKLHNDRFPVELPEICIKLSGIKPGNVVLDPFMGSGTTAVAAKNLGMSYIGFEKNEEHVKTCEERLKTI